MSILIPSIVPEMSRPPTPEMLVTLAERMSEKLVGSALMFGHVIPMELMWIGSQLGHLKLSAAGARPTLRKTPEAVLRVETSRRRGTRSFAPRR